MGVRTPGERVSGEIERDRLSEIGVDFVEESEEEGEEGEMRKLVWGRVGGWVDWAVGWMDFRIDGEEEEGPAEEEALDEINHSGNIPERQGQEESGMKRRRKRDEGDRINVQQLENVGTVDVQPPKNGEGIWKDAAWLLSVASKVIV